MDQPTPKEPRGPVSLRIKFRSANLDQFIERYAVDVSRGGIFIRTREPLAVGTQLRFDFQLQDAAPLLAGEGTIVWIRENDPSRAGVTPGMGVRFDKLTAASQPTLDRILAEKARREQSGGLAKPGPASGMAVRRPSSTFSALDPDAARAAAPPRVGGLSPLGAAPRAAAPATGSGPVGAPRTAAAATGSGAVAGARPRTTTPAVGSDPFGARGGAAPSGVASESSGAFGRPRSTTGMNAMRPAPAPSSLFEKPSAEDIDRALSVLTEVDGAAPAPVPTPVDFSSRVRRPTDAQPMVVEAMPDVGEAPKAPHRRPTDAQPTILESSPDLGNAPARPKAGTQPFFTSAATGDTRAKTIPVTPLGDISNEPLHDEEEEDDATSAWVGSGPTRVGEDQPIPAAAMGPKADEALAQAPTVVAKLGEGRLAEAKPVAAPPRRPSSPSLLAAAAPPPQPVPGAAAPRPAAPSAPPAIMAPNFAAEALPAPKGKKGSGGTFAAVALVLLAAGGGAAWYFIKGPGHAMLAKSGATVESNAPVLTAEGTAPAQPTAAPAEPDKAAAPANAETKPAEKPAEAKPAEKPAEAKPAEAKPTEAKPAEAKAEEKPSEAKAEGKPHKSKRRAASEAAADQKPAEAAPAVADVSPKPSEAAAKPEGVAAKPAGDTAAGEAKPAGGGHVLKITSSPTGAEVIVDGTSMGTTPFSTGDVDPTLPHSVTIKKDGFEAYEHMIGGSDWPRPKGGVRTLKLSAKLRSTGGSEPPKPAESDSPSGEPPPGLGTTPASPKRE